MQGLSLDLPPQVPERDVERADGMNHRAATAVVASCIVHVIPEASTFEVITAKQHGLQANCVGM